MDGYNDNKVRFKKKFFRILKSQKLIMKTKKTKSKGWKRKSEEETERVVSGKKDLIFYDVNKRVEVPLGSINKIYIIFSPFR